MLKKTFLFLIGSSAFFSLFSADSSDMARGIKRILSSEEFEETGESAPKSLRLDSSTSPEIDDAQPMEFELSEEDPLGVYSPFPELKTSIEEFHIQCITKDGQYDGETLCVDKNVLEHFGTFYALLIQPFTGLFQLLEDDFLKINEINFDRHAFFDIQCSRMVFQTLLSLVSEHLKNPNIVNFAELLTKDGQELTKELIADLLVAAQKLELQKPLLEKLALTVRPFFLTDSSRLHFLADDPYVRKAIDVIEDLKIETYFEAPYPAKIPLEERSDIQPTPPPSIKKFSILQNKPENTSCKVITTGDKKELYYIYETSTADPIIHHWISPSERFLCIRTKHSPLIIINLTTKQQVRCNNMAFWVTSVEFNSQENYAITRSTDNLFESLLINLETGESAWIQGDYTRVPDPSFKSFTPEKNQVVLNRDLFSENQNFFSTKFSDGSQKVFKIQKNPLRLQEIEKYSTKPIPPTIVQLLETPAKEPKGPKRTVAFSKDESLLATNNLRPCDLHIYDVATQTLLQTIALKNEIMEAGFSSDKKLIHIQSIDDTQSIFDLETKKLRYYTKLDGYRPDFKFSEKNDSLLSLIWKIDFSGIKTLTTKQRYLLGSLIQQKTLSYEKGSRMPIKRDHLLGFLSKPLTKVWESIPDCYKHAI